MTERILLVDDEATLLETLAFNLRASGYEVVTAVDGVTALEQAHAEAPDLIILDLMLPELDGLTVCRSLRQVSDTPILVPPRDGRVGQDRRPGKRRRRLRPNPSVRELQAASRRCYGAPATPAGRWIARQPGAQLVSTARF
jgi:hypothetical protein